MLKILHTHLSVQDPKRRLMNSHPNPREPQRDTGLELIAGASRFSDLASKVQRSGVEFCILVLEVSKLLPACCTLQTATAFLARNLISRFQHDGDIVQEGASSLE